MHEPNQKIVRIAIPTRPGRQASPDGPFVRKMSLQDPT